MTIRASKSQPALRRYQEGVIAIVALSGTLVSAHVHPSASNAAYRPPEAIAAPRHNIILFIPDGLRSTDVTPQDSPALAALAQEGVSFPNSHALYPTSSAANAAALSSGHFPGDTGAYSDTFFVNGAVQAASNSAMPSVHRGDVQAEMRILVAADKAGYATAVIGADAPSALFASRDTATVVIDNASGSNNGVPLSAATQSVLRNAGLAVAAPQSATAASETPLTADLRERYFTATATQALLPYYAAHHMPFALVIWSHGTGHDDEPPVTPASNAPASLAALRRADQSLANIRAAVLRLGLGPTTDILVASTHGASTVSRRSKSSYAASPAFQDVHAGDLPPDFVAIDLSHALHLALFDGAAPHLPLTPAPGRLPQSDDLLLGTDAASPKARVVAEGGSDVIYLPGPRLDRSLAARIVRVLAAEDYTSGIFVDDRLGKIGGTLPLSAIHWVGTSATPRPAVVVSFRSFSTTCARKLRCTVEVADTRAPAGQGIQGAFERADTANFMAAWGPDFRLHSVDAKPVSTADYGVTMAYILQLRPLHRGGLTGRRLDEILRRPVANQPPQPIMTRLFNSMPAADGRVTVLREQTYAGEQYLDAAGYLGRTVGL